MEDLTPQEIAFQEATLTLAAIAKIAQECPTTIEHALVDIEDHIRVIRKYLAQAV